MKFSLYELILLSLSILFLISWIWTGIKCNLYAVFAFVMSLLLYLVFGNKEVIKNGKEENI